MLQIQHWQKYIDKFTLESFGGFDVVAENWWVNQTQLNQYLFHFFVH